MFLYSATLLCAVVAAHLNAEDVNVIAIDWGLLSTNYTVGLANAPLVGAIIASFINILSNGFTYNVDLIRIVGVGLGGHIAGIAARRAIGEIPHIIALDPSLIGWTDHPDKLSPNDAVFVEVLHPTSGLYGYDVPLGDIDFYVNGGYNQSGCGIDTGCSQLHAYLLYAESIDAETNQGNRFVGTRCEDYAQAIANNCTGDRDITFGGSETKRGGSGIYTFSTNNSPPYAQG